VGGILHVADKAVIRMMTGLLHLLIKALGKSRKKFLAPLTRY
jgi:hypothetical protein